MSRSSTVDPSTLKPSFSSLRSGPHSLTAVAERRKTDFASPCDFLLRPGIQARHAEVQSVIALTLRLTAGQRQQPTRCFTHPISADAGRADSDSAAEVQELAGALTA